MRPTCSAYEICWLTNVASARLTPHQQKSLSSKSAATLLMNGAAMRQQHRLPR